MHYVRLLSVGAAATLFGAACAGDGPSPLDAGPANAGGSGAAGSGGSGGSAARSGSGGAGGTAVSGSTGGSGGGGGTSYAGPPACAEGSFRCNGQCVSVDEPTSGNCSYHARADGVFRMAAAANGDLYASLSGTQFGESETFGRIPKGGGTAIPLSAERYNIENIEIVGNTLYFSTSGEASTVHPRMVGRVGRIGLPTGVPEVIVGDIPNGVLRVTATHIYVGAQLIEPGIRRYDLDGKNETLLTNANIKDFRIAGDRAYIIEESNQIEAVQQMPLTGGELTAFGGGQCQRVLGAVGDTLYAQCKGLVGISRTNPTSKQTLVNGTVDSPVLAGNYIYFYETDDITDGPYTVQRVGLTDQKVETLGTFEGRRINGPVVASDGVYVSINPSITFPLKPGAVLRIALP